MTENQYIVELEGLLRRLPLEERQDIVQDIREYFVEGREDGKTDDEITASLGFPSTIATELLSSYPESTEVVGTSTGSEVIHIKRVIIKVFPSTFSMEHLFCLLQ